MSARTAYIAALPREIAPLVKGWRVEESLLAKGIFLYRQGSGIVASAGIGQRRVALAVEAALALGDVSQLTSVGVAGACDPALAPGAVLRPSTVVDSLTGERFQAIRGDGSTLATIAVVADSAEKSRLFAGYNAQLVDMEAAQVARMALQQGLPFSALKSISDAVDLALPDTMRFLSATGQFKENAFALYLLPRPHLWRPVLKLARGSKLAIATLCEEIRREISGEDLS
jgi:adenosylhomocysteine nucleosidase